MEGQAGSRRVAFAPRAVRAPARPKAPFPSLSALLSERQRLWDAALEPGTRKAYERHLRSWSSFTTAFSLPSFPSAHSLSLFIAYRLSFSLPKTVAGELTGLAYHYKRIDLLKWNDARYSSDVARALVGAAKLNPHMPVKAVPLPLDVLSSAVSSLLSPSMSYHDLLFSAMSIVAFFSCARAQELTNYDDPAFRDHSKSIQRSSVSLSPKGFSASLPYHKADLLYTGTKLWFAALDAGKLLDVVRLYLRVRDALFGAKGNLWIRLDGSTPTRRSFVARVKAAFGARYTGHSFRAGGASWYALRGASDGHIKRVGRWKSDTWTEYVRLQPDVAIAARERDAGAPALPPPSFDSSAISHLLP